MTQYLTNIYLWGQGWFRFGELSFKPGWGNGPKWWALYLLDHGINVLTGGAVEPVSRRAHRHRSGALWDFLLDLIERFDPGHGAMAGPAMWGSDECSKPVQIIVALGLIAGIVWVLT